MTASTQDRAACPPQPAPDFYKPQTLTLEQAAAMLNTTPDTVSECIRFAGLPAVKIGRAYVLVDVDVMAWLRAQYGRPAAR